VWSIRGTDVPYLEVWGPLGRDVVELEGGRVSVGLSSDCDVTLASDRAVSRVHLMIELVGGAWCMTDLGSRNGTFVNGERLFGTRPLRTDDEVVLGRSRLIFKDRPGVVDTSTDVIAPPPDLTTRERDVLTELCRPLLLGDVFVQPATVHEIAQALFVVDTAVKQHLARLYDKFGIDEEGSVPRRVRLANAAIQSGAITLAELRVRRTP
jgi:hypothetical protein